MPITISRSEGDAAIVGGGSSGDLASKGETIAGYAAVFDVVTELFRWDDMVYEEVIQRGAFTKSLARGDDVACVVEHEWGRIVARRSGETLELVEDQTGLRYKATLAKTTEGLDLAENIRHGNIKGSSFRFFPASDREECFDRMEADAVGAQRKVRVCKRTIIEADISDVSPCVWPAYPTTTVDIEDSKEPGQRSMRSAEALAARLAHVPEWVRASVVERCDAEEKNAIAAMLRRVQSASAIARVEAAKAAMNSAL